MNIEIANRLFELRKKSNLSQEELAEKIGVSRQAVSKWERAESSPDTDNLIQLAKLYDVSLDNLLFTDEPVSTKSEGEKASPEFVSVSLEGVHVIDKDGSEVHVGLRGINIKNKNNSDFDEDVYKSWDEIKETSKKRFLKSLPVPMIAIVIYLAIGIIYNAWHPFWLIFLFVPAYYQIAAMFEAKTLRKKLNVFPVSVLCVIAFLYMGFWYSIWHPAWLIFLLIPIYHSFVNAFVPKK